MLTNCASLKFANAFGSRDPFVCKILSLFRHQLLCIKHYTTKIQSTIPVCMEYLARHCIMDTMLMILTGYNIILSTACLIK